MGRLINKNGADHESTPRLGYTLSFLLWRYQGDLLDEPHLETIVDTTDRSDDPGMLLE